MMGRTSSPIPRTSAEIRQSFLDFFEDRGHTVVPSSSLIPGGDQTLLFTNAGMVQFKDVFLGTGSRPYTRATDSQKCMRVAGKHNDLDEVGRDDTHHTFFEMLGNWSFGDYYKKDAITWAWELLTEVWSFPKDRLYATCFEDEKDEIPRDDEAAENWRSQPGFIPDHVLFFGRAENFWEMADTGPCGPDSEIHFDRGSEYCNKQEDPDHVCQVNGDCQRYLELWNLVFIQYNRTSPSNLDPLPSTHVDTGMGFERVVSVLQDVDSNYRTDLFTPLLDSIQALTGHSDEEREQHFTPYRVIADHARAAAFLIADGVVPGNLGRNYVCRMIIRRGSRFGNKIGLDKPFMAKVAESVVEHYSDFYPELARNQSAIYQTITDEERRFHRTIDIGISHLMNVIEETRAADSDIIPGIKAFDLYATHGLPFEITRDIAREHGTDTDETGFFEAMEIHRLVSGSEVGFETQPEIDTELFRKLLADLQKTGALGSEGVVYDPYSGFAQEADILAILKDGTLVESASTNDQAALVIPETPFYIEAGGQVADTGTISSVADPGWTMTVQGTYQPIDGLVVHYGHVTNGEPKVGDQALAMIDEPRRWDIMRNHTATHLLHATLRQVLGEHVRQAGSLVAPDRLRFDFTHPEAMTSEQITQVEQLVNEAILSNYELQIQHETRDDAVAQGAMALFGETYGETVRTVSIGDKERLSYELCGGTHVENTGAIGSFLILSEGSVASGIRRIEAITGRGAQKVIQSRLNALKRMASKLETDPDKLEVKVDDLLEKHVNLERDLRRYREDEAVAHYEALQPSEVAGIHVLSGTIPDGDADILRRLTDRFRAKHSVGVIVLASTSENRAVIVAAISPDLVDRGLDAAELVDDVAAIVGGKGGGKPTLAQAGGKDPEKIPDALAIVPGWVKDRLT
jgi:alanyl-tRNA synthetase